jgi:hypothetical protein
MTGPAPESRGRPARDDRTPRVFRALHAGHDLHDAEAAAFVAVPKGTAWYTGLSIGEIACQISDPDRDDIAPDIPVPVALPARPAPAGAPAAGPATPARAAAAPGRIS